MNLHREAQTIALGAWEESQADLDTASDYVHQSCDGHEVAIYHHRGIQFCATHDTDTGEEWLEDCGGIAQPGDSFGAIACRIAFATLYCASLEALQEIADNADS